MPAHLDDDGNVVNKECLEDMMPWSGAFHEYVKECNKTRISRYSGMFPEPAIPKPPKKVASIAPENSGQNSA